MKKTIPTSLAGTLFYIEEDAYAKLSNYLEAITKHFAGHAEKDEIISDIQSRIAEQFSDGNPEKIVDLNRVESVIASMGTIEDFSDSEEVPPQAEKIKRKLFRDPDDKIIAGVASGLARYFNIDPLIVRFIFIIVVLFGGSGILVYIILWLVMPEAETAAEKLQMRGERMTIQSVNDLVKKKLEEANINKSTFRKMIEVVVAGFRTIVRALAPIFRKIVGFVLTVLSAIALFCLTFMFAVSIFNLQSPYVDFPLMQIGDTVAVVAGLIAGFFMLFVPALFALLLGRRIMRKRSRINQTVAFSLLGCWCLAIIATGVIGTKIVPEYRTYMETSPRYKEISQNIDLGNFTAVNITNGNKVSVVEGPELKVTANGTTEGIERTDFAIENDTLTISRKEKFKICIFCTDSVPHVTIEVPTLSRISASNGSEFTATTTSMTNLEITLQNGSRGILNVNTNDLKINQSNASWLTAMGTSTNTTINLSNGSYLSAKNLSASTTDITLRNGSDAHVYATGALTVTAENGSHVGYTGNPTVKKDVQSGATITHDEKNNTDSEN